MLLNILSWLLILCGIFLNLTATMGLYRLPDFYSRIHAAGIGDTFSAALILIGLMLMAGLNLVTVKLILILLFIWFTSPISSHSLVKAAYQSGLKPILSNKESAD